MRVLIVTKEGYDSICKDSMEFIPTIGDKIRLPFPGKTPTVFSVVDVVWDIRTADYKPPDYFVDVLVVITVEPLDSDWNEAYRYMSSS